MRRPERDEVFRKHRAGAPPGYFACEAAGLQWLAQAGAAPVVRVLDVDPRIDEHVDPLLPRPGDLVTVRVTHGAPHHLVADSALTGGPYAVRRTRAGDAWAQRQRARAGLGGDDHGHGHGGGGHGGGHGGAPAAGPVVLGLPTVRAR
jgi:tRNA-2-methylthio-N6-dimethylallyladenosine synthase